MAAVSQFTLGSWWGGKLDTCRGALADYEAGIDTGRVGVPRGVMPRSAGADTDFVGGIYTVQVGVAPGYDSS